MGQEDWYFRLAFKYLTLRSNRHVLTDLMLHGVPRDYHGHDIQTLGAEAQAVDAGDVGAFVVHRLHQLNESNEPR